MTRLTAPSSVRSRRPTARWVATAAALLVGGPAAAVVVARLTGWQGIPLTQLVVVTPEAVVAAGLAALLAAAGRRRLLALACVAVALGAPVQDLTLPGTAAAAGGPELTVVSSNAEFGRVDARELASLVRREHADVLVVVELTPALVRGLQRAGLGDDLPHTDLASADEASGTGVWTRRPLRELPAIAGTRSSALRAQLPVGAGGVVTLTAVHPFARPPVRPRARGGGLAPSWPSNAAVPPLLRLDHVLASPGVTTVATRTVRLAGTDHRAVVARLRLPAAG